MTDNAPVVEVGTSIMERPNQCASAYYTIVFKGSSTQIKEAVELFDEVIDDQTCFSKYLDDAKKKTRSRHIDTRYSWDKYVDDDGDILACEEEDDDEQIHEEYFDVTDTHACVWIEDILQLANDLAFFVPEISFSISGSIEDSSDGPEDMMDFRIDYIDKKLVTKKTCWYICIYMDDFDDYCEFAQKICDQYGNPRYSEEDYQGFLECADKWYVLDSGQGEFSVDVPFEKTVRDRIKKPKRYY